MIEQAKFTYYHLGKALEKQSKTSQDQERKWFDDLKALKPHAQQLTIRDVIREDQLMERREKNKNETEKIKDIEKMINREDSIFETNKHIFNFQQFETIRSFAKNIFGGKFTLHNADESQSNLLLEIIKCNPKKDGWSI